MSEYRLVLSTIGSQEEARNLARELVERGLAACVNIVPGVHSIYRWQGKVDSGDELLLIMKTTAAKADALGAAIRELHPYDLPESLTLEISGGSSEYLAWISDAVR